MEPLLHETHATPRCAQGASQALEDKECPMSGTLCLVLMLLWDLGRVSDWTLGGWLHLLPLLAVAIVLLNIREAVGQAHPLAEDTVPDLWPSTDQHHEREMIRGAHPFSKHCLVSLWGRAVQRRRQKLCQSPKMIHRYSLLYHNDMKEHHEEEQGNQDERRYHSQAV